MRAKYVKKQGAPAHTVSPIWATEAPSGGEVDTGVKTRDGKPKMAKYDRGDFLCQASLHDESRVVISADDFHATYERMP